MNTNGVEPEGPSIEVLGLSDLQTGTIDVGVPLKDNVVQLNAGEFSSRARLDIDTRKDRMVVIKRQDGAPLQVESVRGWGAHTSRIPAFEAGLDELVLIREQDPEMWTVTGDDLVIADEDVLEDFINVVTYHANNKQRRMIRNLQAMRPEGHMLTSHRLWNLRSGAVDLGVPQRNGVIRTEAGGMDSKSRLDVIVDAKRMVVVRRQDGELMQVEWQPILSEYFVRAFARPIMELVLVGAREKGQWIATGEGVEIADHNALQTFIDKIAIFGNEKQLSQ